MTECANRLIKLLDYIEQIEKLKRKPAYTVPTDIFVAYQDEIKGLSSTSRVRGTIFG